MTGPESWAVGPVPVGLGGSVFGWLITAAESEAVLDRFFEIGGRFIDTSDAYSAARRDEGSDSETIIGRWAQRNGVSAELRVCTKVGLCPGVEGLRRETVRTAVERSRERLGVEQLEAVLAHADDVTVPPEEIAVALGSLREAGVRHVGVSGFTADRLASVVVAAEDSSLGPLELVQEELSLAARSFEKGELSALCASRGLGLMSTGSLAQGFLTGKFRQATGRVGHRQRVVARRYGGERQSRLLGVIEEVAGRNGVSMGAVALRWLVAHPSVVLPLASVTRPGQLTSFSEAGRLQLAAEDQALLQVASTV